MRIEEGGGLPVFEQTYEMSNSAVARFMLLIFLYFFPLHPLPTQRLLSSNQCAFLLHTHIGPPHITSQ